MKKLTHILSATAILFTLSFSAFAADTSVPADVENLKASPLNGGVRLTWDKATDDTGVTGYKVFYGLDSVGEGEDYEKSKDVKNVTEYSMQDLENGKKYYFSVIAYDAAGNESAYWAPEASATPKADAGSGDDKKAPTVQDAEAISMEEVKVVFSEAVVLPEEDSQDAFTIENEDTLELLNVVSAEIDEEDESEATVILTTGKQTENQDYKLTVGIDIKDKSNNPIVSGTSDTAKFAGSGEEKEAEDKEGPKLTKVEAVDNTHVALTFDETIVLSIDPSTNFKIMAKGGEKGDTGRVLEVLGVKLGPNSANVEDATAILTTAKQAKVQYTLNLIGLKDEAGNLADADASSDFEGIEAKEIPDGDDNGEEPDVIPPKDAAKFIAKAILEAKKYVVNLTWEIPAENLDDVVEQVLYQSNDKGKKYEKKTSLETGIDKYKVEGLDAGEYWFKLTQKDQAGNESEGIITKVVLSETGPEMIGLVAVSLMLGRIVTRRKKK